MEADTPITFASLKEMTVKERDDLLIGIRDRRLQPVRIYEQLSLMKAEARKEMLETQWEKALHMFEKELIRADKALDALGVRATKLRAIELEIEQI
jgi:hypothetical protein